MPCPEFSLSQAWIPSRAHQGSFLPLAVAWWIAAGIVAGINDRVDGARTVQVAEEGPAALRENVRSLRAAI